MIYQELNDLKRWMIKAVNTHTGQVCRFEEILASTYEDAVHISEHVLSDKYPPNSWTHIDIIPRTPCVGECGLMWQSSEEPSNLLVDIGGHSPYEEANHTERTAFERVLILSEKMKRRKSTRSLIRLESERQDIVEDMLENFILWGWDPMSIMEMRRAHNVFV